MLRPGAKKFQKLGASTVKRPAPPPPKFVTGGPLRPTGIRQSTSSQGSQDEAPTEKENGRAAASPVASRAGPDRSAARKSSVTFNASPPPETTPVETTPVETTPVETTPVDDGCDATKHRDARASASRGFSSATTEEYVASQSQRQSEGDDAPDADGAIAVTAAARHESPPPPRFPPRHASPRDEPPVVRETARREAESARRKAPGAVPGEEAAKAEPTKRRKVDAAPKAKTAKKAKSRGETDDDDDDDDDDEYDAKPTKRRRDAPNGAAKEATSLREAAPKGRRKNDAAPKSDESAPKSDESAKATVSASRRGADDAASSPSAAPRLPRRGDFLLHRHNEREKLEENGFVAEVLSTPRKAHGSYDIVAKFYNVAGEARCPLWFKMQEFGSRWRYATEAEAEDARAEAVEDVFCSYCASGDDEDSLLLCDGCSAAAHARCLRPPLANIPDAWFCVKCISQSSAAAAALAKKRRRAPARCSGAPSDAPTPPTEWIFTLLEGEIHGATMPRWPHAGEYIVHRHNDGETLAERATVARVKALLRNGKLTHEYSLEWLNCEKRFGCSVLKEDAYGVQWRFASRADLVAEYGAPPSSQDDGAPPSSQGDGAPPTSQDDEDLCRVCGESDGSTVVLCDGCDGPFHLDCVGIAAVPEGDWFCADCVPAAGPDLAPDLADLDLFDLAEPAPRDAVTPPELPATQ